MPLVVFKMRSALSPSLLPIVNKAEVTLHVFQGELAAYTISLINERYYPSSTVVLKDKVRSLMHDKHKIQMLH